MKRISKESKKSDILDAEYLEDNVIPFPHSLEGKRSVVIPKGENATHLVTITIGGDSLKGLGITHGDQLVCRTNIKHSEVKNGRLVVADIPGLGMVVKLFYRSNNMIILQSANPKCEPLIYRDDAIQIRAVVIQSIKNWN
jgi:SOS-response transcriptional repressor LexA